MAPLRCFLRAEILSRVATLNLSSPQLNVAAPVPLRLPAARQIHWAAPE